MRSFTKILMILILLGTACQAPAQRFTSPTSTIDETRVSIDRTPLLGPPDPTRTFEPTRTPESTTVPSTPQPLASITPGARLTPANPACAYSPLTAVLLQQTSAEQWLDWIEKLSGAEPVTINGVETRITTRYSPAMFSGNPNARAFEFVLETVRGWYPGAQISVSDYTVKDEQENEYTWKNLALTLPGATRPDEIVILSAHLDSITATNPETLAPGAEDNGSGAAALLEAARLLRAYHFQRTIQIVWFTGEELGLLGSSAFVGKIADPTKVIGAVNLDMFGYDSDSDRCFEVHAGELPQSARVGQCFIDSLEAYHLGLQQYDFLTDNAIRASDHASFWEANIGAIEVVEDVIRQDQPGGCPASDQSPYYHTEGDTVDKINPESGIMLVRAALATTAALAGPLETP